jgi:hypothetical protein
MAVEFPEKRPSETTVLKRVLRSTSDSTERFRERWTHLTEREE